MNQSYPRHINFESVPNFRDLGGQRSAPRRQPITQLSRWPDSSAFAGPRLAVAVVPNPEARGLDTVAADSRPPATDLSRRYLGVAVARCSLACSRLSVRRQSLPRPRWQRANTHAGSSPWIGVAWNQPEPVLAPSETAPIHRVLGWTGCITLFTTDSPILSPMSVPTRVEKR
jgi:hypothetical protein